MKELRLWERILSLLKHNATQSFTIAEITQKFNVSRRSIKISVEHLMRKGLVRRFEPIEARYACVWGHVEGQDELFKEA